MNKELNLVAILKDCPKGTKLYCTIFGDVKFECIANSFSPIRVRTIPSNNIMEFTSDGLFTDKYHGECVLFPSKENRDWSTFKVPVKRFKVSEFQPFDKVLCRQNNSDRWTCEFFAERLYPIKDDPWVRIIGRNLYYQCIPYNDETKHLVGSWDDCPDYYKWWEG